MCEDTGPTDTRDLKVQIFDRGEYWRYGCKDPYGALSPAAKQAAAVLRLLEALVEEARQ